MEHWNIGTFLKKKNDSLKKILYVDFVEILSLESKNKQDLFCTLLAYSYIRKLKGVEHVPVPLTLNAKLNKKLI